MGDCNTSETDWTPLGVCAINWSHVAVLSSGTIFLTQFSERSLDVQGYYTQLRILDVFMEYVYKCHSVHTGKLTIG